MEKMSWIHAAIMGLVQGLTEFLPVSSSGHLVLSKFVLGAEIDTSALFDILLHVGTLVAVFAVYYKDIWDLIKEGLLLIKDTFAWVFRKKKIEMYAGRKMVLFIIVASIPTALLGLLMETFLEDIFLSSVLAVGCALLVTGTVLLLLSKLPEGHKKLDQMNGKDALFIGLIQGIATIPGISRSGSTISAGLFRGLNKEFAIRFSFLMSIPAILGAAVLKLIKVDGQDLLLNLGPYVMGMIIAALSGYLCVKWLINLLKNNRFHYFGFYCLIAGLTAVVWSFL